MYKKILAILLFVLILSVTVSAGEISENLTRLTKTAPADSMVNVIIQLRNSAYSTGKLGDAISARKSQAARHADGIQFLKNAARQAQNSLLNELDNYKDASRAENIESFWLANIVSATIPIGEIERIGNRPDVTLIYLPPRIVPIEATPSSSIIPRKAMAGVQSNLTYIGADQAWTAGYDGTGTIICSFDSGVEGNHPALADNWKGLDGNPSAAWYDPLGNSAFPQTFPEAGTSQHHGTHVMGIMVGHDESTGDTIGVAPGAKWISAAVIDLPYVSLLKAFQWAADPDGNPNTIADVPDVINHSWGIPKSDIGCEDYLGELIDNLELLGVINIFAAGNYGFSGAETVQYPANRANDAVDNFAVGNINHSTEAIAGNSSRGPSDCDHTSIKPNVVAPGVDIFSAWNGDYTEQSGTSMAAPHVAGACAILRQAFPEATPAEIKNALLSTAVMLPAWGTSPNNNYGYGVIDIPAALAALSPAGLTDLRIYSIRNTIVPPGESISEFIDVINNGASVTGVTGNIANSDGGLEITNGTFTFGAIAQDAIVQSNVTFDATVSDTVTPGRILSATLHLTDDAAYSKDVMIIIRTAEIPPDGTPTFYTHSTGRIDFTITNFGQFGFGNGAFFPIGYDGFAFDGSSNQLYEGAFIIGYDVDHVSDGARNFVAEPDNDFAVAQNGTMQILTPGPDADQQTISIFDDSFAENPMGLEITQKSYAWTSPPDDDIIILEFVIKNVSNTAVDGLYAGLLLDWDIISASNNTGGYDNGTMTPYMYYDLTGVEDLRGIRFLNSESIHSGNFVQNDGSLKLTETDKFTEISNGEKDTAPAAHEDFMMIVSTGLASLSPDESDTCAIAILAADNLAGLVDAAVRAQASYTQITDVTEISDDLLPERFLLSQNYPNPFNPSTSIRFEIPSRNRVMLDVFDILGRKVKNLVNKDLPAGKYLATWDGRNEGGMAVASGVYFYTIKYGGISEARKMLLLK